MSSRVYAGYRATPAQVAASSKVNAFMRRRGLLGTYFCSAGPCRGGGVNVFALGPNHSRAPWAALLAAGVPGLWFDTALGVGSWSVSPSSVGRTF